MSEHLEEIDDTFKSRACFANNSNNSHPRRDFLFFLHMFSSILRAVAVRCNHRNLFTRLGRRGITRLWTPQVQDMLDTLPVSRTWASNGDLVIIYDKTPDVPKKYYKSWKFAEEPCGFAVKQGLGFMQVEFGERIGPEGRYEILRKLGWGMHSNIWLARDTM